MVRFAKGFVMALAAVGFLGGASVALAAEQYDCAVTKDGKEMIMKVATKEECTKMGGKIVEPAAKPKTQ